MQQEKTTSAEPNLGLRDEALLLQARLVIG